ncbi:FxLD family lanthipeptide [Streptomyces sp. NPDC048637]|uniref:FxLD family lanthipeptide n=1 Tax=Streptomyces sp. NPDC048637 TaxID=3155636 RepID=UPI0034341795
MMLSTLEGRPEAIGAVAQDPFDLDITVLDAGEATTELAASDGGCGSTCGTSCVSNAA